MKIIENLVAIGFTVLLMCLFTDFFWRNHGELNREIAKYFNKPVTQTVAKR